MRNGKVHPRDLRRILLDMPKAELHCHLDGSLRVQTILDLARQCKAKLPATTEKDLRPFVQVSPTCQSLKECLDAFKILYPLLRRPEAVERVAYELCEDSARENIRYLEVRFAPVLQAHAKFSTEEVVESALKGLRKGYQNFGVESGVILCLFRSHSPGENRKAFETLKRFYGEAPQDRLPKVVGMDLAGDEARHPTMEFADFFKEARRLKIPTTCHAGETKGTANLKAALELRVSRIGHGTHLMEAPRLRNEVIRQGIPLEIGLTSNARTKSVPDIRSHPILDFYRAGVQVTLNTDDRGIFGIDLTHEYQTAHGLGLSLEDLREINLTAVRHIFAPDGIRKKLEKEFAKWVPDS